MPLRDYQCPSCNHILSNQLSYSTDAVMPVCIQCGQVMQMVYSAPALKFIGDGFYCNDYAPKKEENDG